MAPSKTTTAMEWIRANTAGHTLQLLEPIIERARKEGGQASAVQSYNRGFQDGQRAAIDEVNLSRVGSDILRSFVHQQEIAAAVDNAKADAIKAFRPENERLERQHEADVLIHGIQMKSERDSYRLLLDHNRLLASKLAAAELLNDFLRNQVSETAKKVDEAKGIIRDLRWYYKKYGSQIPGCPCTQCTFDRRSAEFVEAA